VLGGWRGGLEVDLIWEVWLSKSPLSAKPLLGPHRNLNLNLNPTSQTPEMANIIVEDMEEIVLGR
jgi:hypothetical protein